jgi:hypothetical protein
LRIWGVAAHHDAKAAGLERQLERSVFSDDDDAIEALKARIAEHEATRDRMKKINAIYRKGDATGLAEMGLDLETLRARVAAEGLSFVKAPYEGWELTNLGVRIRADRERIKVIQARQARSSRAESSGGVLVEAIGGEWARVTFTEKPARTILDALRVAGFRWDRGSWSGRRADLPETLSNPK